MLLLYFRSIIAFLFVCSLDYHSLQAEEWTVPLAGNTFQTQPAPGNSSFGRDGSVSIASQADTYSAFVYFDRPASVRLDVVGKSLQNSTALTIRVGQEERSVHFNGEDIQTVSVGEFSILEKGYAHIDFRLNSDSDSAAGADAVKLLELRIKSDVKDLGVDFVRNNDGNMFYWGRRGPSVHLGYKIPGEMKVQYAYNEITVPVGEDPLGSYYMAIGFSEGYFGFQVNGPEERRVLFSVWSPFSTDNPKDIPEDQRIEALARGPDVHIGEFGNEGSGGQSYLRYPWIAGKTYRFLAEVKPEGNDKTIYTAWFSEKGADDWRLIASFRRPKTNTYLRGFHSFLESFSPAYGYIGRRALYGNQWVYDVEGNWHECVEARFTVDATGGGRHRLDFAGGTQGNQFYLRNCGFFSETGMPGTVFKRTSTSADKPQINLDTLPMN